MRKLYVLKLLIVVFVVLNSIDFLQTLLFLEYERNPRIIEYPWLLYVKPLLFLLLFLLPLFRRLDRTVDISDRKKSWIYAISIAFLVMGDICYLYAVMWNLYAISTILR